MPEICLFCGIKISMFFDEHNPPHFHAEYGEDEAVVGILSGTVLRGRLPRRQLKYVLAWAEAHTDELMQNWEIARAGGKLEKIAPPIF